MGKPYSAWQSGTLPLCPPTPIGGFGVCLQDPMGACRGPQHQPRDVFCETQGFCDAGSLGDSSQLDGIVETGDSSTAQRGGHECHFLETVVKFTEHKMIHLTNFKHAAREC